MLDYLVTSRTRRNLLGLLWGEKKEGSVSALARQARMSFAATHRELESMCQAGLALASRSGKEVIFSRNGQHPQASLLDALTRPADQATDTSHDDEVRGWLKAMGAPLTCPPASTTPAPAVVLAAALTLSHRDATVARVLPLVLWRQFLNTDLSELTRAARQVDELHTLGFFLHVTGHLANDRALVRRAVSLRDHRRTRSRAFFVGRPGRHALAAARKNTPPIARQWGFIMNLGMDSFESVFEKHA